MFKKISIALGIMLSGHAFAVSDYSAPFGSQWVMGLSSGATWVTGNKTQTITLKPDIQKTYVAGNNVPTTANYELFLGLQKPLILPMIQQSLMSQLGISVGGAGNARLSGDIWEDADPAFNNSNYQYKIQHTHVAVKAKLIGYVNHLFEPYISAGIGVGFNRTYDFTIKPSIMSEVAPPPFGSNTKTTFIYTLGMGLQKSFNPHLHAAIGYEFADWGKTQLASAAGQTLNQGLSLNHLYANQLQLALFYTF
jgi:opacity protein-like surface antigen